MVFGGGVVWSDPCHLMAQDAGRGERVAEVYAAASAADPGNEELLSQLALAHLRHFDFKQQQMVRSLLSSLPEHSF